MNEKFAKESKDVSSMFSTMEDRFSNCHFIFNSMNNRLNHLSTRVENMFNFITNSNENACSVSCKYSNVLPKTSSQIHNESSVSYKSPNVLTSGRHKRFNPNVHNFDPSTHRLFRGRRDPLSNMYTHCSCNSNDKCMLNVNTFGFSGSFDFSEKAFTYYKALFNYRYDLLDKIVKCSSPWDCKNIGDKIVVSEHWLSIREQVMMDIQLAKYIGCTSFRNEIHVNKCKYIVENTSDPFWGRGINNTGKNMLGVIHMKLIKNIYSV